MGFSKSFMFAHAKRNPFPTHVLFDIMKACLLQTHNHLGTEFDLFTPNLTQFYN